MAASINEQGKRIKTALDLVIRDQEGKYDECLAERLFDFLAEGDKDMLNVAPQVLTDIYEDEDFVTRNHSRLFRLHRAFELVKPPERSKIREYFCYSIKRTVDKNDTLEIKAMLTLMIAVVDDTPTDSVLMDQLITCTKHFLTASTNYHIQNLACSMLTTLIKRAIKKKEYHGHNYISKLTNELIKQGSPGIYYALDDVLSDENSMYELKAIYETLNEALDFAIENKQSRNIIRISRCLGWAGYEFIEPVTEKLRNARNLEALLTYSGQNNSMFSLTENLISAILFQCKGRKAEMLIDKLEIDRKDRLFIESHIQARHVSLCLQHLKELSTSLDDTGTIQVLGALTEYIRDKFSKPDEEFKNLMDCCRILRSVYDNMATISCLSEDEIAIPVQTLSEVLGMFEDDMQANQKAVALEIIRLMSVSLQKLATHEQDANNKIRIIMVDLAEWATDLDILKEIGLLFCESNFGFALDPECDHQFANIVCNKMRRLADKHQDSELQATTIVLMSTIEAVANDQILAANDLVRFETVPCLIADILADRAIDDKSLETISQILVARPMEVICGMRTQYLLDTQLESSLRYVSLVCKFSSKSTIENLARAICTAIRRGLDPSYQTILMTSLRIIIDEYIRPQVIALKILVNTSILETLYFIHEISTEDGIHSEACETIRSLELNLTKPANNIMNLHKKYKNEDPLCARQTKDLIEFYCDYDHSACKEVGVETKKGNKLDMLSYVNQVLEQVDSISFDCY